MIFDKTVQLTRIIQGFTERFLKIFLGFDLLSNVIPGLDTSALQFTIYTINKNKVGIKGKIHQDKNSAVIIFDRHFSYERQNTVGIQLSDMSGN